MGLHRIPNSPRVSSDTPRVYLCCMFRIVALRISIKLFIIITKNTTSRWFPIHSSGLILLICCGKILQLYKNLYYFRLNRSVCAAVDSGIQAAGSQPTRICRSLGCGWLKGPTASLLRSWQCQELRGCYLTSGVSVNVPIQCVIAVLFPIVHKHGPCK